MKRRGLWGLHGSETSSLLCWRSDYVISLVSAPEHDLPVINIHTSLEFLNEEEKKMVLGLAADLFSRDLWFIHLRDAYSFGIYYPPPAPQCQAEPINHFYFCVLCYLKCFPRYKIFVGETSFIDIKSTVLGDLQSFCICFLPVHTFYWKGLLCSNWTGTIRYLMCFSLFSSGRCFICSLLQLTS